MGVSHTSTQLGEGHTAQPHSKATHSPDAPIACSEMPFEASSVHCTDTSNFLSESKRLLALAQKIATGIIDQALSNFPQLEVLLVGGFPRDQLRSSVSKDIDLEVSGMTSAQLQQALEVLYPGKVKPQGAAFPIFKLLISEQLEVEISIRQPEGGSFVDGAKRRDFTFNAIGMNAATGACLDPFNGKADLEQGILRAIIPEELFDHPLRIFRGMQFYGRLGLSQVDPLTTEWISRTVDANRIFEAPKIEISAQFRKLLLFSERPSYGFQFLRAHGILQKHFQPLHKLADTPQDPKWHPEGNVWTHTLSVLDECAKIVNEPERKFSSQEKIIILLAALFHDVGKGETTELKKVSGPDGSQIEKITSYNHERVGQQLARPLIKAMGFSHSVAVNVGKLVAAHMIPSELYRRYSDRQITMTQYTNLVRQCVRDIHPANSKMLVALVEADQRGRDRADDLDDRLKACSLFSETVTLQGFDDNPRSTLVRGAELEAAGLNASQFREIITKVEALRDKGRLQTASEALEFVRATFLLTRQDLEEIGIMGGEQIGRTLRDFKVQARSGLIETREAALNWLRAHAKAAQT